MLLTRTNTCWLCLYMFLDVCRVSKVRFDNFPPWSVSSTVATFRNITPDLPFHLSSGRDQFWDLDSLFLERNCFRYSWSDCDDQICNTHRHTEILAYGKQSAGRGNEACIILYCSSVLVGPLHQRKQHKDWKKGELWGDDCKGRGGRVEKGKYHVLMRSCWLRYVISLSLIVIFFVCVFVLVLQLGWTWAQCPGWGKPGVKSKQPSLTS